MDWIPWGFHDYDRDNFPPEEYQKSKVGINDMTGEEEVIHYSYGNLDNDDAYNTHFPFFLNDGF